LKILVTGAAGFIGSHLSEYLVQRGDNVVGLDNFNDYYDPAKKRTNEARLNEYKNFRIVEADIRDRHLIMSLFESESFDAVAHLAALAGVRNAVKNPLEYVMVDYVATQHLMDGARATTVGNFVFASTSSVYGNTRAIPFVETDPCDRPLQPYAAAKRAAELLGFSYHYLYDLNFTVLRFFTVYGPNGRPDMMAYLVAESATKDVMVPLYEAGQMYRDWTFVQDTVLGIAAAIDRPMGYEIINLGRGEPTLLSDFVAMIEGMAGRKANLVHKTKPAADVVATYADIAKARSLLDYNPTVSVQEGVSIFWNWYVENAA